MRTAVSIIILFIAMASAVGATDLSDYPYPFFSDGQLDAVMVTGDDASPSDLIGLIDIAQSMQLSAVVKETIEIESDQPVVSGDTVKSYRYGDDLEINELLADVSETYDASDALALKSYVVSTSKGLTHANQYLKFAWGSTASEKSSAKAVYAEDDNSVIGDFLLFEDGTTAFQYELEFSEGLESDVVSGKLPDLEGRTLNILGSEFSVVDAKYSPSDGVTLQLMGGAVEDILGEQESRTYEIDGVEYEVTLTIVSDWPGASSDAKVKFLVNGMMTKELTAGDTAVLGDGIVLGVKEVLPNEAGEVGIGDIVSFYLGAYKIELSDNYAADTWDGTVKVSGEAIEDASLLISYSVADEAVTIRKISYRLKVDSPNEGYIPPGSGLRSVLSEPEGMLGMRWDVRYEGLTEPGTADITILPHGDDAYSLEFKNQQDISYTLRLAFADSGLYYGSDSKALVFSQGTGTDAGNFTIHPGDQFVLSHNGRTEKGVTRVLEFDSFDTSEGLAMFTELGTGASVVSVYSGTLAAGWTDCQGELNIGGYSFKYYCITDGLLIDLDDDGSVGGESTVVSSGGAILDLGSQAAGSYMPAVPYIYLNLTTPANKFNERSSDESFGINITESSDDVDLTVVGLTEHSTDSDSRLSMTDYGVLVERKTDSNDPDKLYIKYPLSQLLPQVYLSFDEKYSLGYSAGTVTIETYPDVPVGSTYSGEQPDLSRYNIVSVGGPCVNPVTAQLMGLDYPACGPDSGIGKGEGFIRTYNSGKALVVAGWEEDDTRKLVDILLDYEWYQQEGVLKGDSYEIV